VEVDEGAIAASRVFGAETVTVTSVVGNGNVVIELVALAAAAGCIVTVTTSLTGPVGAIDELEAAAGAKIPPTAEPELVTVLSTVTLLPCVIVMAV
jgi:hypothetical protein